MIIEPFRSGKFQGPARQNPLEHGVTNRGRLSMTLVAFERDDFGEDHMDHMHSFCNMSRRGLLRAQACSQILPSLHMRVWRQFTTRVFFGALQHP